MKLITGILIAGGQSSRLNTDKATFVYRDKMLAKWSNICLSSVSEPIIVASNTIEHAQFGDLIAEDIKGAGPLAGLYAALHKMETEWAIVLPCDTPLMETRILERLISLRENHQAIVAVDKSGKVHPLVALYHKSVLDKIEVQMEEKKYALMRLLDNVKTKYVNFDELEAFKNLNTLEDVE